MEELMGATVFGGENVQILTSGGKIDPNIYNVEFIKKDLIGLSCKETGIQIKVNNQRIYKVLNQKGNEMNDIATVDKIATKVVGTPGFSITPKPKIKSAKSQPIKIDFDSMAENGFEIWTKSGLSLGDDPKVTKINVAAHCIIDPSPEPRGYEVFNSYNGTRGVKGKNGKRYYFSEKMTLEKKRKLLAKKGYVQQ
jgi:hypothetical protein